MQQPYAVPNYGSSFTQSVTSRYGSINPGPSTVPAFTSFTDGQINAAEMLGTASDISNNAQYTPIVHTVMVKIGSREGEIKEGTFLREGDLVVAFNDHSSVNAAGARLFKDTDDNKSVLFFRADDQSTQNLTGQPIRVVASDVEVRKGTNCKHVYVALAWAGTQTVNFKITDCLHNNNPFNKRRGGPAIFAGETIYVKCTTTPGDRVKFTLTDTHAHANNTGDDSNLQSYQCLGALTLGYHAQDLSASVCLLP